MPAERVSMKKIRDVLRLTFELGMSRRKVREATGIGRTAVTDCVQRAGAAGLVWPLPVGLDDIGLERLLFPPADALQSLASTEPDWAVVHAEMKRRGVTMTLLCAHSGDRDRSYRSIATTRSDRLRPVWCGVLGGTVGCVG